MESNQENGKQLEFFVSEKLPFLVVSLKGALTKGNAEKIDSCFEAVRTTKARAVVLSLHDVHEMDLGGIPPFTRLQAEIRKKAELRVCFIKANHYEMLTSKAAIRESEVHPDLSAALASLAHVRQK